MISMATVASELCSQQASDAEVKVSLMHQVWSPF